MNEYEGKYEIVKTSGSMDKKSENITTFVKRIEELDCNDIRTIVILKILPIYIKNRKYLKIIGLDVYTASIVLIIDTNGKEYGVYSYNESMLKLKNNTVIKATFKYTLLENYANVLRITSDYSIIGISDIIKLKSKYDELQYNNFINSFAEMDELFDLYKNKEFYTFAHFTGTQLRKYKQRYQIKMGGYSVNFCEDINVSNFEKFYFRGYALILCRLYKSKPYFTINEIWGKFISDKKLIELKNDAQMSNYFQKLCSTQFNDNNGEELNSSIRFEEDKYEIDGLTLRNAFRYYELASKYEQQYTCDYVSDGCDDSYFEEWEDDYSDDLSDSQYYDKPLLVEPSGWESNSDEGYDNHEEKNIFYEKKVEYLNCEKSEQIHIKEFSLDNRDEQYTDDCENYGCLLKSNVYLEDEASKEKSISFNKKYKIISIVNDEFAIDLQRIKIPEAEISEIPF